MKKLALLLFIVSSAAMAQAWGGSTPCIWSSSYAECIASSGITTRNGGGLFLKELTANGTSGFILKAAEATTATSTVALPGIDVSSHQANQGYYMAISSTSGNIAQLGWVSSSATQNLGIAAAVGSSALTISLKTQGGNNPSATDSVTVPIRDTTQTNGTYFPYTETGATSMTVSSGSTLGTTSGVESVIYVYANEDGLNGVTLAVSSTLVDTAQIQAVTAEGGSGGADSGTAVYGPSTDNFAALRLIGKLYSTQATAGTWATQPATAASVDLRDVGSAGIADGSIVNADVNASAAIAGSKIVSATDAVSGVVTTSAQNFAGAKTFYDGVILDDAAGQATLAYYRTDGATGVSFSSGGCGTGATYSWSATRIGRLVTVEVSYVLGSGPGTSDCNSATGVIPSWAAPTTSLYSAMYPLDFPNGIYWNCNIQSNGQIILNNRDVDTGARGTWISSGGQPCVNSYAVDF